MGSNLAVNNRRDLELDIAIYKDCTAFAFATVLWSPFLGYRVWGGFASVAYLAGAAHATWLLIGHSRGGWFAFSQTRRRHLSVSLILGRL